MLGKWHIKNVECGMYGMWDVGDVGCSGCGMCGMWDVRDVGCGMFAGMWDVDLQNAVAIKNNIFIHKILASLQELHFVINLQEKISEVNDEGKMPKLRLRCMWVEPYENSKFASGAVRTSSAANIQTKVRALHCHFSSRHWLC